MSEIDAQWSIRDDREKRERIAEYGVPIRPQIYCTIATVVKSVASCPHCSESTQCSFNYDQHAIKKVVVEELTGDSRGISKKSVYITF